MKKKIYSCVCWWFGGTFVKLAAGDLAKGVTLAEHIQEPCGALLETLWNWICRVQLNPLNDAILYDSSSLEQAFSSNTKLDKVQWADGCEEATSQESDVWSSQSVTATEGLIVPTACEMTTSFGSFPHSLYNTSKRWSLYPPSNAFNLCSVGERPRFNRNH